MIDFPMLGVYLSQSWHMASRCFCWLHLRFVVGVGFLTSCKMSSRRSSNLHLNIQTFCCVVTLGVDLPASCLMASRGLIWNSESSHARRQFPGVVSDRIPRLIYAKYVLCRHCGDWRLGAAHRCGRIVPYGFWRLFLALFSVLSRRRVDTCRDARRLFVSVVSCGFPVLMYIMRSRVGVTTTRVATLGVDLRSSCILPSICSYTLYKECFVSVSTA
jgi:hypothetical protein